MMPRISDHEEFLNAGMVANGDILVLLDAGAFKSPEETGLQREVFHIRVGLPDQRQKTWSMNKTTQREIAKMYGDDSKLWIGKQVRVEVLRQNTPSGMKDVVYGHPVESKTVHIQQPIVKGSEPSPSTLEWLQTCRTIIAENVPIPANEWNNLSSEMKKELQELGLIAVKYDYPYLTEKCRQYIKD